MSSLDSSFTNGLEGVLDAFFPGDFDSFFTGDMNSFLIVDVPSTFTGGLISFFTCFLPGDFRPFFSGEFCFKSWRCLRSALNRTECAQPAYGPYRFLDR